MQHTLVSQRAFYRQTIVAAIIGLALFILAAAQIALAQQSEEVLPANLGGSSKTVDQAEALPGSLLQYTIVLSNSGDASTGVTLTDTLPADLVYVDSTFSAPVNGIGQGGYSSGVITWTGTLGAAGYVNITVEATLTTTVAPGTTVTNTAEITGTGSLITRSATTLVVSEPPTKTAYLPIVFRVIPAVTLQSTTPNSNNDWTLSWNSAGSGITGYELQESTDASFSTVTTYNLASNVTSQLIHHDPSVVSAYYYRVRAKGETQPGLWSNSVTVAVQQATVVVQISRPNSANDWTVSWNTIAGVTSYELQEAQDANFTNPTTINTGTTPSYAVNTHEPSTNNEYFYRARAFFGATSTAWSEVKSVVSAYRDDFNNANSGWAIRRTTLLEDVRSFYENGRLIMQVEDPYDWGITSPMRKAPTVPYVIEYAAQSANETPSASSGLSFGADWPGTICPDYSTIQGIYQHQLCFNQFYNTNNIFAAAADPTMIFERVDELVWCPTCGGSPMKRLGDIDANNTVTLSDFDLPNWNEYRIEVRANSIRVYAGGVFRFEYTDTRYVNDPYFGFFGSTSEYSSSTWRIDWIQVLPLDN